MRVNERDIGEEKKITQGRALGNQERDNRKGDDKKSRWEGNRGQNKKRNHVRRKIKSVGWKIVAPRP